MIGRRLLLWGLGLVLGLGAAGQLAAGSRPTRILRAGDSITRGSSGADAGDPRVGGYRPRLWRRLADAGLPIDAVGDRASGPFGTDRDHAGHEGWTIAQVHAGLRSWLPRHRPDVILLMVGTNDLWWGADSDHAPERLAELLDDVSRRAPDVEILVAAIPPFADRELDRRAVAFNMAVREIVDGRRAAGRRLSFVDGHGALDASDLADGVHPNERGYEKLADAWFVVLAPVLRELRRQ